MTAANLGSRVTGYGFVVFTSGALCWIAVGAADSPARAHVDQCRARGPRPVRYLALAWPPVARGGGSSQLQLKRAKPLSARTLFPVSLLSRAQSNSAGKEIGHCVDAMAGCGSGRLSYVVVSQGGIAGVGETLRRLPWGKATVEKETLVTSLSRR